MPRSDQVVITIHGINSAGEWQDRVHHIIEPHFKHEMIRYPHYRWFGFSKQLLSLRCLVIGAVVAVAAWLVYPSLSVFGLIAAVTLLLCIFDAIRLRAVAASEVLAKLEDYAAKSPEPPHVIAHSFGTYLIGRLLKDVVTTRIGRAVFVGCVLPRGYNWRGVASRGGVQLLRNETRTWDMVVWLAGAGSVALRCFGAAGLRGFRGDSDLITTLTEPYAACPLCSGTASARRCIHNVRLPRYSHVPVPDSVPGLLQRLIPVSGLRFKRLTPVHAEELWLPFLWGIDPGEFRDLRDKCRRMRELERVRDTFALAQAEKELHETKWQWAALRANEPAIRFRDYVIKEIESRHADPALVDRVIRLVCVVITEAIEQRKLGSQLWNASKVCALYPPWAVGRAVEALAPKKAAS